MKVVEFASYFLLCSFLVYVFARIINELWWTPLRVQRMMKRQGIKGFSYSFPHGNTKEIIKMRKESLSKPMDLSHNIFPRIQPHLYSWLNLYGKNFVTWFGPRADFVVTEVDLVKEIMNKDNAFPKTDTQGLVKTLLGDGLVTSKGQKWANRRKMANHAFHAESLKSMTPAMLASAEMMLERWKEHQGKEIEVSEEFRLLTSEVISRTAFGSSYLEGKDIFEKLIQLGVIIARSSFKLKLPGISRIYKTNDEMEAKKLEQGIHNSILKIMEKRKSASASSGGLLGSYGTDFLGLLMKAMNNDDEKNRITVQDVVDECKTFYIAGQETTSTLLTWVMFLLGIHTDWQEKARQEVFNIFGQEKPSSESLSKLKTLNMIINETLRLYPPAPTFIRKVKEETRLGKLVLPANIHILIPILTLHHNKEIWGNDSHLFKPERFSEGVANATNNNSAVFVPFGLGPRSCVGSNFAINEAKIVLSMILQRYSFTLSPTYIHSPVPVLTIRAQHGVQVMLHPL